jgi:hypothetical protein
LASTTELAAIALLAEMHNHVLFYILNRLDTGLGISLVKHEVLGGHIEQRVAQLQMLYDLSCKALVENQA